MSAKILITGATGTIGKSLVKQLQASKVDFIAGTRDVNKAQTTLNLMEDQCVKFDFTDEKSFERALENVDRVFILGPPLTFNLDRILKSFVDYLNQKSINRVVYLSAFGNESLGGDLAFHAIMESYLKERNFKYTILQPSFFSQNFKNYEYENLVERGITFNVAGDGKVGFVDTEDVAKVAVKALTEPGHSGKTYQLTGPELFSYHDAAHLLSDVLNKKIVYPNPSEEEYRGALKAGGAPDFIADYMIPIFGMIKTGKVGYLTDDIEGVIGKKPTDLKTVLERDFGK
ncbi:SDR family oxidoreductase [Cryomorpha ignava]|uniref:SDR family oxidoreductase n=1 Tax=Cryomorpha ignava TaxID=101383 RepID=A0A7K3WVD9_9FLAO|nr:SDR family oxidoreductase [Cryomorpha ignava]NEN25673.1 SDR family oxidoreductase [Cryomorpha ignava]